MRKELRDAIHGSGAFRMFRNAIRRLGLEEAWYQFRNSVFEEIAHDWLKGHNAPYKWQHR